MKLFEIREELERLIDSIDDRIAARVDPETGEVRTLNAFLYIMHEDRSLGLPTGGYVDVCRQGYRDFGFDESTLAEALAFTRDHRGEE